jgi:arsenite oxidase small subunit
LRKSTIYKLLRLQTSIPKSELIHTTIDVTAGLETNQARAILARRRNECTDQQINTGGVSMSKMDRRSFLKSSGIAAAVPLIGSTSAVLAKEHSNPNGPQFPELKLGNANQLAENQPVSFSYPDADSPCAMIRMGKPVPGGVGPNSDIVAYSILCNHMGCPLQYDKGSRTFKCGCHFSVFDSEKAGQMVTGQATENLPQILLNYDENTGDVHAIGVDGLIFGRQDNQL